MFCETFFSFSLFSFLLLSTATLHYYDTPRIARKPKETDALISRMMMRVDPREQVLYSGSKTKIGQVESELLPSIALYICCEPCLSIRIYNGKRFSGNLCIVLHVLRDLHQREVMIHMPISRRNEIGRNGNTIENEMHRLVGRNDHFGDFVNLVLMSERLPDR